ncbi:hypothetical protein [Indiicoccus explosivorum]|uniref:hypothetical protein n=1 Tax=Indiicoccus explosivorum TaxID=1917864 RepID=UPI000B43743A|nr:hypothetical protein [Indiicoccus explosivorum]
MTGDTLIILGLILTVSIIAISFMYFSNKRNVNSYRGEDIEITTFNSRNMDERESRKIDKEELQKVIPTITEIPSIREMESGFTKVNLPPIATNDIARTFAAGAIAFQDSKAFKVQFSPEIVEGIKNGTVSFLKRQDDTGLLPTVTKKGVKGFYKQATLVQNVNPALVANASFNLLSAAVGQKQLADIQKSLKSIDEKVGDLLKSRDNDFRGSITGGFKYFKEAVERYQSGATSINGPEDHQIEEKYREIITDIETLHKDMRDGLEKVDGLKKGEWIRRIKQPAFLKDLEKYLEGFDSKQEIVKLNLNFIDTCYIPYLTVVRGYENVIPTSRTYQKLMKEHNELIQEMNNKLINIGRDFDVKIALRKENYKARAIEGVNGKLIEPIEASGYNPIHIPSQLLIEKGIDGKVYAYVPSEKKDKITYQYTS